MNLANRLAARFRALGVNAPGVWTIHRTYAGHWQRSAGAFSWFITSDACGKHMGGFFPGALCDHPLSTLSSQGGDRVLEPPDDVIQRYLERKRRRR